MVFTNTLQWFTLLFQHYSHLAGKRTTKIFITSYYSNGDYTILQSQTYERTEIPIYSMIIIPTEYDIDIDINPQPTTDTHKKLKLITILCMSIGIPVIVVCMIILIYFLTKYKRNTNMNNQKFEYSISNVSENTQIMNPLIGPTIY